MSEMLNINLITVTSGEFQAANGLKPKKHKATQRQSSKQIVESLKMGETLSAVSVDWALLRDSSRRVALSFFVRAIKFCQESQKEEFVVANIVPWIRVGRDNPSAVMQAQNDIVAIFMEAIAGRRRDIPEFRLNLRRGEFDVRFYLGKEKPTDCHFDDDCH